jgi:LemA protein
MGIIIFLLLILIGSVIGVYNTLVTAWQDIKTQWSNILTEYQRRADLFMNLAESVKSHKKFEKSTLEEITKARSGIFAGNQQTQMKQIKKLDNLFAGMKLTFENYPELKSNTLYKDLMENVRETEDRINISRTDFNAVVRDYNIYIKVFPTNILANMFNYNEYAYFEADDSVKKSPKMNLD